MRAMAESTRVVITTVGPYIHYGEPVVAACAAAGTHYVDLTGEPEFVDLMWLRHHEQAQRTGAKLVHSCGFDSIPYDLGALYTVGALPEDVPIKLEGFVRVGGTFSGGTFHSAVHVMARLRQGRQVAAQRKRLETQPDGRRVRGITGPPHRDSTAGGWALPAPTIDPITVLRSARRAGPLRAGLQLRPLHRRQAPAGGGRAGRRRRHRRRAGPAAADPQGAAQAQGSGRRAQTPSSAPRGGSRSASAARAAAGAWSPRSPAATPATARRRRCWPSRRCASPTTTCPSAPASSRLRWRWARPLIDRLVAAGIGFATVSDEPAA